MIVSMKKNGSVLALFALVCTSVVALTHSLTESKIAEQEQKQLLSIINQLLPADSHDNNIFESCKLITNTEFLGSEEPQRVFNATLNGESVGYAIEGIAPDGYNGKIKLVVGIDNQKMITGVRVLSHQETPGLGDKIDYAKSKWVDDFIGQSLTAENDATWAVIKDGGEFDAFTGATITPRAIVKAVKNILALYNQSELAEAASAPSCWSENE